MLPAERGGNLTLRFGEGGVSPTLLYHLYAPNVYAYMCALIVRFNCTMKWDVCYCCESRVAGMWVHHKVCVDVLTKSDSVRFGCLLQIKRILIMVR